MRVWRPIPVDRYQWTSPGKCFNCFSPDHQVVNCRSLARCFRCRGLGHRAPDCRRCPGVVLPDVSQTERVVWRPKPSPAGAAPMTNLAPSSVASEPSLGQKRRRHRQRKKARRAPAKRLMTAPHLCRPVTRSVASLRLLPPALAVYWTAWMTWRRGKKVLRVLNHTVIVGCPYSIVSSIASRFEMRCPRCPSGTLGTQGSS